jgi:hypothetical protein
MEFEKGRDYYLEDGRVICGSNCRHCAFDPPYTKGNDNLKDYLKDKK